MPANQTPILTITLNPALDVSTHVDAVMAGPKLRCAAPTVNPGGGGINVARAIHILGGTAQALVALGGATGTRLADALAHDGIPHHPFPGPGETRQSLAVTDDTNGAQYRFVLPGAEWAAKDVAAVLARIADITPQGALVVISGSQPPGVPADFAAQVATVLAGRAQLVLDTSGAALAQAVAHPIPGLAILRMDSDEAEGLVGHPLPTRQHSAIFAAGLVARGVAACVIVARGADGSVLADATGQLFSPAADVPVQSKVGAGDSFVAGHVLALARNQPPAIALAHGVAAASAAVMTPATDLCRKSDVDRLLPLCAAVPI